MKRIDEHANSTVAVDDERAAFEAWTAKHGCDIARRSDRECAAYADHYTDDMWDGWKARAAFGAQPVERTVGPVAWVRYRSDGGFEGPIMDSDVRMEGSRRTSGAWTPLYAAPHPATKDQS